MHRPDRIAEKINARISVSGKKWKDEFVVMVFPLLQFGIRVTRS